MSDTTNPWAAPFARLTNVEVLREEARVRGVPLVGLERLEPQAGAMALELGLSGVFVPTARACEIMKRVIDAGHAHALAFHADRKAHLYRCYRQDLDIEPYAPMMLTGLAGTGKSAIRRAIGRLLESQGEVKLDADHEAAPLVPVQAIEVRARASISAMLTPLASEDVRTKESKISASELPDNCAHWLYLTGTCLVLADELQFLTLSKVANAKITEALLVISYLRTPWFVAANFSLIHRLKARAIEERQRLLAQLILLVPDPPDSADWLEVLQEYQCVAKGLFDFDFVAKAADLWCLTAGLKRVLIKLLCLAFRLAREAGYASVSWELIGTAYRAHEYAPTRGDVESLVLHGFRGEGLCDDLKSPFDDVHAEIEAYNASLRRVRKAMVAAAARESSLTASEQRNLDAIEREASSSLEKMPRGKPKGGRKRVSPPTANSLVENFARFKRGKI